MNPATPPPLPSPLPPPITQAIPPPPLAPICQTCRQGVLLRRKTFRMSGPVVAIGFVLLIPSILGIAFGFLLLFATGAAGSGTSKDRERKIRAQLATRQVPEQIIAEVVSGETVPEAELAPLTYEQREAVRTAERSISAQKLGAGTAVVMVGGFALFVIVGSFVGGLLGWILVMRKRILQCPRCGAVVPAS